MKVEEIIKQYTGKNVVPMPEMSDVWLQWYTGDVKDFHSYEDYNGVKKITCKRHTLNMGKKIAEDWANLLLNEKTSIACGSEKQQVALDQLLDSVNFREKGNEGVEKSFGLGNGAFVVGFDKNKEWLQFVNYQKVKVLTIEQDTVTECAFVNQGTDRAVIQIHIRGEIRDDKVILDNTKNYIIMTLKYKVKNGEITELEEKPQLLDTKTPERWFRMVRPNIANNIDINSPLGISVFANSLDALRGVDLGYDAYCEEMRIGKAKMFIDKKLTNYDENGEHLVFDVNQTGFYYLGGDTDNKQPLTIYSPQLRTEQIFAGINNTLNLLSAKCGFGENHYRFDGGSITTATQVVSENSEMFRSLKKHEILLEPVIIGICRALMYIHNTFIGDGFKFDLDDDLKVDFDDSIIEDKQTEMLNDRQDVASGLMSKVEYRMKHYNEDENTAKKAIEEIQANSGTINFFSEE